MRAIISALFEAPKIVVWNHQKHNEAFDCVVELVMDEVITKEKQLAKDAAYASHDRASMHALLTCLLLPRQSG